MVLTPAPVSAYVVTILAAILAILVTNRRGCPRLLRIIARNLFLLVVLLYVFQSFSMLFSHWPAPLLSVPLVPAAPATLDSVVGGPSLSADFVNRVLAAAGS